VRKHLKLEEPLFYHYADQMGMLVWAELACPSTYSKVSARAFNSQIEPMVGLLGNHPSVVIWGLYNEEWGLDWDIPGSEPRADAARDAYDLLHRIDSSRPIVENSGWAHIKTDLVDWHYYDDDPRRWAERLTELADGSRDDFEVRLGHDFVVDKRLYGDEHFPRTGVPILNSEYGSGFTSLERAWHMRWQTQEIRRHDRFAGYVYTELADVEHEMAGLYDAERRRKDWGGLNPADVNADTVVIVDLTPKYAGADMPIPDQPVPVSFRVSHHGEHALKGRFASAWIQAGSVVPRSPTSDVTFSEWLAVDPFVVSQQLTVVVQPPGRAARLAVWFIDEDSRVHAQAFVDAAPIHPPNRRGARAD